MQTNTGEIILYQPESSSDFKIEVRIEDETVWLTQAQMADLFSATKQNVSLHINNIFKEKELSDTSTVKESLTVQKEGNRVVRRKVAYYNLDVIISVGYRVKSQRGTQFRIWATKILKDYLLQGYAINQRQRNKRVKATIYTQKISKQFQLDLDKYNAQYETVNVKTFTKSHDRFLIIDEKEIYLIGASLKDLGKKWFAFSKMNTDIAEMLKRLNTI